MLPEEIAIPLLELRVKSVVVAKLASIVRCPAAAEPGAVPRALSELISNVPAFISVVAVWVFVPVKVNVPEPFLVMLAVPFPLITPGIVSVWPESISKTAADDPDPDCNRIPLLASRSKLDDTWSVPLINWILSLSTDPGIAPTLAAEETDKAPSCIPTKPLFVLFPVKTSVPVPALIKFPDPAIIPP